MEIEMDDNLFGERVVSDRARARLKKRHEQGKLFETDLTPEERKARQLAEQHKAEGGKDLFEGPPN